MEFVVIVIAVMLAVDDIARKIIDYKKFEISNDKYKDWLKDE